jgi:hypothetical protein
MGWILAAVLLATLLTNSAWAAGMTRAQYRKNLIYNKNARPAGWQYQTGYNLWRSRRGLPVNRNTYRMYTRDRAWHNNMRRNHQIEAIVMNATDWTTEELTLFLRRNQDLFQFHPAGWEK